MTTADIGFGAGRIILDDDEAVSQLIRAPFVFFALSFFNYYNRPKKNAVQTKATGGRL